MAPHWNCITQVDVAQVCFYYLHLKHLQMSNTTRANWKLSKQRQMAERTLHICTWAFGDEHKRIKWRKCISFFGSLVGSALIAKTGIQHLMWLCCERKMVTRDVLWWCLLKLNMHVSFNKKTNEQTHDTPIKMIEKRNLTWQSNSIFAIVPLMQNPLYNQLKHWCKTAQLARLFQLSCALCSLPPHPSFPNLHQHTVQSSPW